jgi:hypothetical protein
MSGCYIYEGSAMVPEEECNRITTQKIAAIDTGLPPPLLLDLPSVANLAPPQAAIRNKYEEDNPPNLTLYYIAGGLVALLIIKKFIF